MKTPMIGEAMVETLPESRDEFAAWVAPFLPRLHRYAARLVDRSDHDDVVQEALIRAWRRRDTFDPQRGDPLPWLLAIVADRARRHRVRSRLWLRLVDHDDAVETPGPDVDLERAITTLSPRQRQAVTLYYFVGLDVEGVAAVMECAPGTVRATLHHARTALRAMLGDAHV